MNTTSNKQENTKKTSIQEKREELKKISHFIQIQVKKGVYNSVNEGLIDMYNQSGHNDLKSFKEWQKEGYSVKKGEKALLLWGVPLAKRKNENENKEKKEENKPDFFPLCFVFSNKQVVLNKGGKNA